MGYSWSRDRYRLGHANDVKIREVKEKSRKYIYCHCKTEYQDEVLRSCDIFEKWFFLFSRSDVGS